MTWADGETGLAGTVSADNSLVGAVVSGVSDQVGSGGVTALAYGNYVVASPAWSNSEGAVTWGNGTTGTVGTVSADNSLVGSISNYNPTGLGDQVGSGGVTSLTNGNYVVVSTSWDGQTGAVTWGDGTTRGPSGPSRLPTGLPSAAQHGRCRKPRRHGLVRWELRGGLSDLEQW